MGWGTGIAIYFIIWWVMIFITLPFRMTSQIEAGEVVEGSDPAAPAQPQLLKRMILNSLLSLLVFGVFWLIFYYFEFSVDDLPEAVPVRPSDNES